MMWSPFSYLVELSRVESQTASRRTRITDSDAGLLQEAWGHKSDPRQLIPSPKVLPESMQRERKSHNVDSWETIVANKSSVNQRKLWKQMLIWSSYNT